MRLPVIQKIHHLTRALECPVDHVTHIIKRRDYLLVGEPQHEPTVRNEPRIAGTVTIRVGVAVTIRFNHQSIRTAGEVGNVRPNRVLASKSHTELTGAEPSPQQGSCERGFLPIATSIPDKAVWFFD
jgi:hypothetical protein